VCQSTGQEMAQVDLRTVCGLGRSLTGYVSSVRAGPGFGDFLGLHEKAFLHVMPGGQLTPRRLSFFKGLVVGWVSKHRSRPEP
jgi:hypothetical protein